MTARHHVAALALGLLFGLGLMVSGMIEPQKVQDFLDFAGRWDPSLMLVMGGALLVTALAFPRVLRRGQPVLAPQFQLPPHKSIDAPLVVGAALFGVGWGLGGFCPGPALVGIATGSRSAMLFVVAMLLGAALHRTYQDFTRPS